ncbi:MAG: hypothetical protein HY579_04290 [Nitrospinae bacterium]|nr:hypothetical protein [Nitrospinota bacterium]
MFIKQGRALRSLALLFKPKTKDVSSLPSPRGRQGASGGGNVSKTFTTPAFRIGPKRGQILCGLFLQTQPLDFPARGFRITIKDFKFFHQIAYPVIGELIQSQFSTKHQDAGKPVVSLLGPECFRPQSFGQQLKILQFARHSGLTDFPRRPLRGDQGLVHLNQFQDGFSIAVFGLVQKVRQVLAKKSGSQKNMG